MAKILGISASLRNARWGVGNRSLISELANCKNENQLFSYLKKEADLHLKNFIRSGRDQNLQFDEIHRNLNKLQGKQGLSNSEVALASALWSASQCNCEVNHVSLSEYFSDSKKNKNIQELLDLVLDADGILISTPVYFGDRGSLSQDFISLLRSTDLISHDLMKNKNKVYAGIAVGAKRNGGQETTLIYQLFDMIQLGFLGVGNDSDTTSQYGGTGLAGDVGTMSSDEYGLRTSMGTGRRMAQVVNLLSHSNSSTQSLVKPVRVHFWILQDKSDVAFNYVQDLIKTCTDSCIEASILKLHEMEIQRCIACDICPTHVDIDEEYRCIIRSQRDSMSKIHSNFLLPDVIIPVAYCSQNRENLSTNYQRFIERTRYLRRGDYVLSDCLTTPLIIEELGCHENMSLRMLTSFLRHHTILTQPMIEYHHNQVFLNQSQVIDRFSSLIYSSKLVTSGKLGLYRDESIQAKALKYNPVGYILSTEKDKENEKLKLRKKSTSHRLNRKTNDALDRLH